MTPSYALGLFFIFLVSVIWSVASIVVQYLYHDQNFHSPFLLTYIGTSLFITLLPTRLLWERRQRIKRWCFRHGVTQDLELEVIPWRSSNNSNYQEVPSVLPVQEVSNNEGTVGGRGGDNKTKKRQIELQPVAATPLEQHKVDGNEDYDDGIVLESAETDAPPFRILSHEDHLKMAMKIAPVWFLANWAYNTSLAYTSITSSTVLASTGSLFTFLLAVTSSDEAFTWLKLSGVLLGIVGSILTGLHDVQSTPTTSPGVNGTDTQGSTITSTPGHSSLGTPDWQDDQQPIWGDLVGLLSAVGYGAYTVLIRLLCPRNEQAMSMQLLLGYVGLLNGLFLFPIAIKLILSTNNTEGNSSDALENGNDDDETSASWTLQQQQQLTWVIFGYLVAKGMLDNVLSDYLWARAVVLTSATVATVGLGLTIPLAFISDWVLLGHANVVSWESVLGALAVLCGFVLVNLDGEEQQDDDSTRIIVPGEEHHDHSQEAKG